MADIPCHRTVTFKMLFYHNSESGNWWFSEWVSSFWKRQLSSKQAEVLRPEAPSFPSPSSILQIGQARGHVCAWMSPPQSCLLVGPNDLIIVKLTPWWCFSQTYDDPGTHDEDLISSYQLLKKSRQFCLEYCIETGGGIQTAFVLKSFPEPCNAAEGPESQSFSQYLKDQNYWSML